MGGPFKGCKRNEWNGSTKEYIIQSEFGEAKQNQTIRNMSGFPMPLILEGEAINCYASNDADKDTFQVLENPNNFSVSNPFDYPMECLKNVVSNTMLSYDQCNDLPLHRSQQQLVGMVVPRPSNGWILPEPGSEPDYCSTSSLFANELSLSLSTSIVNNGTLVQERCLETTSSGVSSGLGLTTYSLHQRHMGSEQTSCNSNNISSSSFGSSKPVEMSHLLLLGSKYFHVMQEILAQIARFALQDLDQTSYSTSGIEDRMGISFPSGRGDQDHWEVETKKKHLLALLQMVDDHFNQCLDEIHTVVSAFHSVTELDPNIHARFALPAISFMYRNLRERISCHILAMGAKFNEGREKEDKSFEASFIKKQWALQQLRTKDHPLWRPQRGLPERSVSVLRAWMFQNFLHPYPKDAEKHLLALKSGLTRSQVSNWFINARVRLWKPMIEEMYAEMNRRKGYRNDEGNDSNSISHMFFENTRFNLQ